MMLGMLDHFSMVWKKYQNPDIEIPEWIVLVDYVLDQVVDKVSLSVLLEYVKDKEIHLTSNHGMMVKIISLWGGLRNFYKCSDDLAATDVCQLNKMHKKSSLEGFIKEFNGFESNDKNLSLVILRDCPHISTVSRKQLRNADWFICDLCQEYNSPMKCKITSNM